MEAKNKTASQYRKLDRMPVTDYFTVHTRKRKMTIAFRLHQWCL